MFEPITLFLFFILISVPLFAVRFSVLHKDISLNVWGKGLLYLTGISQDLFILGEQLLIFMLLKMFLPIPLLATLIIFVAFIFLMHFNVIVDGFLYKQTSIRLEASFLSFFDDLKCFWDSGKERGFWIVLPLAGVLLSLNILAFAYYLNPLMHLALSPALLGLILLLGIPGILAEIFMDKKLTYGTSNVVYQQQIWLIKKIIRMITKKKNLEQLDREAIRKLFPLNGEKATFVSKSYPLLKFTHGFEGEKLFDVEVKEGEKPHVIFLFMESFRAKDVGCLGGKDTTTPHFDALAKEGVLFKNFYSNSIKTSRAVTASLFGIPSDVDSSNASNKIDLPLIGVADVMKQHGYHTAYFHNGTLQFENQLDFFKHHGFETIRGKDNIIEDFPKATSTSWGVHDEFLMKYTSNWLNNYSLKEPSFITMFTITNHHPWTTPPGYGESTPKLSLKSAYQRYEQTFRYSDKALGEFISDLKSSGMSKKCVLFILGDHGQPMGEHNQNYSSQNGLYEENVHVPLLIWADGRIKQPKEIDMPGSQVDLFPTLLDLLGIKGFNHAIGNSLFRRCDDRQIYFHNPYVYGFFGCRKGPYKYIYSSSTSESELYNLEKDPEEKINLASWHEDKVSGFKSQVKDYQSIFKTVYENRMLVDTKKRNLIDIEPIFE